MLFICYYSKLDFCKIVHDLFIYLSLSNKSYVEYGNKPCAKLCFDLKNIDASMIGFVLYREKEKGCLLYIP